MSYRLAYSEIFCHCRMSVYTESSDDYTFFIDWLICDHQSWKLLTYLFYDYLDTFDSATGLWKQRDNYELSYQIAASSLGHKNTERFFEIHQNYDQETTFYFRTHFLNIVFFSVFVPFLE